MSESIALVHCFNAFFSGILSQMSLGDMSGRYITNESTCLMHCLLLCSRYNGYTREAYFNVGLQGIAEKDVKTVREIIDRTIEEVIEYVRGSW